MPSLEWNKTKWGTLHDWPQQAEEWSHVWGGVESHWIRTILPRVRRFLPAKTVLEIAPGYGRWSACLLPLCDSYLGVDIAEPCIKACNERFSDIEYARFFVNDGRSLSMAGD